MSYSKCSVISPEFKDGLHPNNIRCLDESNAWTIHIDETGNQFGDDDVEEERVGRLVALAVPKGIYLKKSIPENFHAADYQNPEHENYNPEFLDEIINEILNKPVGVFGIQYNDNLAKSSPNWWSGVHTLIQMVLKMLPLYQDGYNKIEINIEQRGYVLKKGLDLSAYTEMLKTELQSIDKSRFSNLDLQIQFVDKKSDKYNGFIDTLAHSWGGGVSAQERCNQAKFNDYCFLNVQDIHAIERLYAVIDDPKKQLNAQDWYNIMVAIANEPKHSLLHDYMKNIGKKVQTNLNIWQSYLHEVQSRLRYKDYSSTRLFEILDWLNLYKPTHTKLPKMLELQFQSAKLASSNHKGQADVVNISTILGLGNSLIEEDAQQVAHTYLRLATAYANALAFDQTREILLQDIMQNKLAIGLSNYAKTLSSLGQYYCFINQPEKAIEYFQQAIDNFSKLSDEKQAKKDITQTQTYLALAYLQSNTSDRQHLRALFNVESLTECVETYAQNKDDTALDLKATDTNYKYKHQIIVRMLNQSQFDDLKNNYLKHSEQWVTGQGHPWQSINFWRGVLLAENGKKEQAQKQFDSILANVTNLSEIDKTLLWIYIVYITAIHQLGYSTDVQIVDIVYPLVKKDLEIEPYDKLNELKQTKDLQKIRQLVLQCLPFNYA